MDDYKVVLTPKARKDLKAIGLHIALDSPVRAISYVIELQGYMHKVLSIFPQSGRLYEGIHTKEVRSMPYQDYVCIYYVDEARQQVNIVHVFNAARDKVAILNAMSKTQRL
jgi:toxin ParE1/3/4